jgi:hypothetical protein
MTAAINLIQDRLAYCLERLAIDPDWFPARKLERHKGPLPLEQTDGRSRWRKFTVEIEGGEEGTTASSGSDMWLTDTLVITVGYPDNLQLPADKYFRGISGMAASDKKRITHMLTRYGPFDAITSTHVAYNGSVGDLPVMGDVQNLTLAGWSFNGKVAKIRFSLEYAEPDE